VDYLGADAIERTSWQIRNAYIDLMTRLGSNRKGDIDWWVTSLASRNTYACPLYLRLCQLILVKNLVDDGRAPAEIVTDSVALADVFRRSMGRSATITLTGERNRFTRMLGFMRHYAAAFYHVLFQYLGSKLWLKKRELPADGAVLVDIFLGACNFAHNHIVDRYYPGMMEALDAADRSKLVYTPIHYKVKDYRRYFKQLDLCQDQLLLKESVLTLADYLYALMHPFRFRGPDKSIEFMGHDIAAVVREALSETFPNSSSVEALLRYRFAKRLHRLGFNPGIIIEWFENQEVDHGAVAGWREFFPEVEVIGYQGFLASPHYFSALPIELEQEFDLLPTKVVVMGENMIESAREFAPSLNVTTGPAFRFSSVWKEIPLAKDTKEFNILVALPIHRRESRNIIDVLAGAVRQTQTASQPGLLIKPHPTWKVADVERLLVGKDFRYELVNADFDDALARSDLVVSAASSACVYAIAQGVPCVVVGIPGSLLENSIHRDADPQLWKACYTAQELAQAITYYSSLNADQKTALQQAAMAFRAVQFKPVTRELVYEFLGTAG